MSQHHFSHNTVFIDSATTCDHTQPSAFLSNLKSMRNRQPIYLTTTQITKSSYTRQLPNLPMSCSDSIITQAHPNIDNISLISLRKLCDDNCEVKLTKNRYTFTKTTLQL